MLRGALGGSTLGGSALGGAHGESMRVWGVWGSSAQGSTLGGAHGESAVYWGGRGALCSALEADVSFSLIILPVVSIDTSLAVHCLMSITLLRSYKTFQLL